MNEYTLREIAKMIDVSCVRTDVTRTEIDRMVEAAKKYKFIAVFAMPCFTPLLKEKMAGETEVMVGGVVGFPSGADTTAMKVQQVAEMKSFGVNEIDMVVNVGELKSGNDAAVLSDIKAVVEAAKPLPVKCIIEIAYLTDDEIRRGSEIVAQSGAVYVKTGTGWGPKPTTVDTIKIMKSVVGDRVKIKAAGGVRDLDTLLAMVDAGCERFGIGVSSVLNIMAEAEARGLK